MSVREPLGATTQGGALGLSAPALSSGARSADARAGLLGLSGLLLSALVISISAPGTSNLLPESVRPVPGWLAGPFGSAGLNLGVPGLIGVLTLMLASYVVAVQAAARLSGRAVLVSIVALHALVLLAPPLLSTDMFSYQAYARMGALYGANPYLHGPYAIALDPVYPFIGAKWVTMPTAYGPLFTTLGYLLAPLSIAASALAYKAIAAFASLAIVALVWKGARLRGLNPVTAAAFVGLNPLIVVYGVGGGHNDLLMLAVSTAGLCLMLRSRERAGGALAVLAAGVKLTGGLLVPFAIAAGGGGRRTWERRRERMVGAGLGGVAVAVLGFTMFGTGPLHLLGTVRKSQSEGDWHSIPGFIGTRFGLGSAGHVASLALAVVFAAVFCWLLRRVWRNEMDWINAAGWATLALLVTASSLLPWYVAWLIPLAALATDRRLWRAALVISAVVQGILLLGYIPHGSSLGL